MAENQRGKAAYFSLRETTRNSTRNGPKLYGDRGDSLRQPDRMFVMFYIARSGLGESCLFV